MTGWRRRGADMRRSESVEIIEGEYRVIEPERIERERNQPPS